MSKITIKAKSIDQPNQSQYTGTVSALDKHKQKFHPWINLANFINNTGECQCGWPTNTAIGRMTFYGIKGYRDIAPIASPVGTFPQPAMLELTNFNFSDKELDSLDFTIKEFSVKFNQRMIGCIVGIGKLIKGCNNSPRFSKVDITLYAEYKDGSTFKSTKTGVGLLCNNDTNTVQTTFTNLKINYSNVKKLAVRIQYPRNESKAGNTGIIYLKNLNLDVDFEYNEPKTISVIKDDSEFLVTDPKDAPNDESCRRSVTHIVKCTGSADCANNIKVENPYNLIIEKTIRNKEAEFKYWDKSGIPGVKHVKYTLDKTQGIEATVNIESKLPQTPTVKFTTTTFKKGTTAQAEDIIKVTNGCFEKIDFKIVENNQPIETLASFNREPNNDNLITIDNEQLHNNIINRPCGNILIWIYVNDVKIGTATLSVIEQNFAINVTELETEYIQNKQDNLRDITITRIDNEPDDEIAITVKDKTTGISEYNLAKGESVTHQISVYKAGTFSVDIDMDTYCRTKSYHYTFKVIPNHRQYFDDLFLRVEDGSAVCYNSLTIMEGDGLPYKMTADNLTEVNDLSDLRVCSADSKSTVNNIGYVPLVLSNTNPDQEIKELLIEINPFVFEGEDKIPAFNEWTDPHGIFAEFVEEFYKINDSVMGLVDIRNLTPDNDYIDSENVYLLIHNIDPNESIELKVPFNTGIEKEIFVEFLLFEEALPLNKITSNGDCSNTANENNYVCIKVTDPIFNTLKITGNTDLNEGEQTPGCDDGNKTKLTYTIKNADTINTNTPVKVLIQNSTELIPYKIKFRGQEIDIENIEEVFFGENNASHASIQDVSVEKPIVNAMLTLDMDEKRYYARTDKNGYATFYYSVPSSRVNGITLTELLNEGVISYDGDNENQPCIIGRIGISIPEDERALTFIKPTKNYKRFKAGSLMKITVNLKASTTEFRNEISIIERFEKKEISIDVYYYTCAKNKKLTTTFKTDDPKLVENSVSEVIYCRVPTNLTLSAALATRIIQENSLNTLKLNVVNKDKPNKDVEVIIDLLNNENNDNPGDYEIFDSSVNNKDYWVKDNIIHWTIGKMDVDQSITEYFRIKAKNTGISKIKINAIDYLNKEG